MNLHNLQGDRSDILKKVSLDVWNNKECQSSYAANNKKNIIRDTQLCAGKKNGGEDSCWVCIKPKKKKFK